MSEIIRDRKEYLERVKDAKVLLFPVQVGQVQTFLPVPKKAVRDTLADWPEDDYIFPFEVAWEHNDKASGKLIHYDGWGSS